MNKTTTLDLFFFFLIILPERWNTQEIKRNPYQLERRALGGAGAEAKGIKNKLSASGQVASHAAAAMAAGAVVVALTQHGLKVTGEVKEKTKNKQR